MFEFINEVTFRHSVLATVFQLKKKILHTIYIYNRRLTIREFVRIGYTLLRTICGRDHSVEVGNNVSCKIKLAQVEGKRSHTTTPVVPDPPASQPPPSCTLGNCITLLLHRVYCVQTFYIITVIDLFSTLALQYFACFLQ